MWTSVTCITGPRWHKRRRTEDGNASHESMSSSDSEDILAASRYWDRNEAKKTSGCMADGLRCCIWGRAMSPGTVSLELTKGWTALRTLRMCRAGNLGLSKVDLAWTAASPLPEPHLLTMMPMLQYLPNKLVHFVLDYHPDWIARLQLPPSDGTHAAISAQKNSTLCWTGWRPFLMSALPSSSSLLLTLATRIGWVCRPFTLSRSPRPNFEGYVYVCIH